MLPTRETKERRELEKRQQNEPEENWKLKLCNQEVMSQKQALELIAKSRD